MANEEVTDFDNGLPYISQNDCEGLQESWPTSEQTLSIASNGNKESKDANKGNIRNC